MSIFSSIIELFYGNTTEIEPVDPSDFPSDSTEETSEDNSEEDNSDKESDNATNVPLLALLVLLFSP